MHITVPCICTHSSSPLGILHHHLLYFSAFNYGSFIHLLFYSQSCCAAAMMAEVLSSACAGTSESQLSALLSMHRKLLVSQDGKPSSMLKGVEDSLNRLSKVPGHKVPTLMIYGCCHTRVSKFPWWGTQCWYCCSLDTESTVGIPNHTVQCKCKHMYFKFFWNTNVYSSSCVVLILLICSIVHMP